MYVSWSVWFRVCRVQGVYGSCSVGFKERRVQGV